MSEFSIIHDAALQLRRSIFDALENTADTDFGLAGSIERITLSSPAADLDDDVVASLYLYRFGINPALRNQQAQPDRDDPQLFHAPPLPLQLHFLFTPLLDAEAGNLLLLGRMLQFLHDTPKLTMINGQLIDDSHGAAPGELRLFAEELPADQLSTLWTAFTTPYRLTTSVRLETVAVDSAQSPRQLSRTMHLAHTAGLRNPVQ